MVIGEIDTVLNWVVKLFNQPREKRAKLLKEEITPIFEQFEKVHAAYLESFSRYREQILNASGDNWLRPLQAMLERDNLFTGDTRSKIVRLAHELEDETLGPFVGSICNYVMDARLLEPLGREIHPHLGQRWRQGFYKTLDRIAEESWQLVLDPNAARPPLSPKEIKQELKQITNKYSFSRKLSKQDAVKRAAALWALDGVVGDMQRQYDLVSLAYVELRSKLAN